LTREIRQAIENNAYPDYVRKAVRLHYPDGGESIPDWVRLGCELAGISL